MLYLAVFLPYIFNEGRSVPMNRTFRFQGFIFIGVIFLLSFDSVHAQKISSQKLDGYVTRILKTFEVPGLAVAIVKDGKPVLTKGYGVRQLGNPARVDNQTLFGIASNTKAFTAAALAILVDEGKIAWDDRVIDHMPEFQMYDPYVTREITVRDLLVHRSGLGLGGGDLLLWPSTTFTRHEIISRLRFVKPASSFRSKYAYDNILYLVAGQIIPEATDTSWDDFVRQRIFAPLGMASSNTSIRSFQSGDNIAIPHARIEGRVQPMEYSNLDNVAPAGAINSNVTDMAKWVIAQLDSGRIRSEQNGKLRLFSSRETDEMWSPQTIIPVRKPPSGLSAVRPNFSGYGLGWVITDYRGKKIVYHTGVLPGMVSRVTLVPDLKLGIVILTNQEAAGAFNALTYYILDTYFGVSPMDWIKVFYSAAKDWEDKAKEIETRQETARVRDSKPSLPPEKYSGQYTDAWYGEVTISLEQETLVLRFSHTPSFVGDLEHWQYDTFVVRWRDRGLRADAFLTFALNPDGSIDQVKMVPVSPLTDFSYDFQDLLLKPVKKDTDTHK